MVVRCPSARRLLLLLLLHALRAVVTRCARPNTDGVGEDGVAEGAVGDDDGDVCAFACRLLLLLRPACGCDEVCAFACRRRRRWGVTEDGSSVVGSMCARSSPTVKTRMRLDPHRDRQGIRGAIRNAPNPRMPFFNPFKPAESGFDS